LPPSTRKSAGHSGFIQNGLVLMVGAKDRDALAANVALGTGHGVPVAIIDATRARALVPGLDTTGAVAFALEENAGYGDGYGTTVAFAGAARELGVESTRTRPPPASSLDTGSAGSPASSPRRERSRRAPWSTPRAVGRPRGALGGCRRPAQARADRGGGHPRARG
jgi:hypothetical protein